MMAHQFPKILAAAGLILLIASLNASAQMSQHQGMEQHQMQQHGMMQQMDQMNNMMQRMDQMMEHCSRMSMNMDQTMKQHQGRMMDPYRLMQDLDKSMGATAQQMKTSMENLNRIMHHERFGSDKAMMEDVDAMSQHMKDMTDQMEKTMQVVEQITKRLQQSDESK